ncbi:MAG: cupredoxin domain-containing protein [Chloroflexi bacterium]|nr:cupredoxin domain-containing protein [Chloroflexota bacterium]
MTIRSRGWYGVLTVLTIALAAACGGAATPSNPTPTAGNPTPTAVRATATATPRATPTQAAAGVTPTAATPTPTAPSGSSGEVVQVEVAPRAFVPDKLSFQAGKTYTLEFSAPAEFHTFTVAELGINVLLEAGKTVRQVVTISKTGTFSLVCAVHEGEGMTGTVTAS